MADLSKGWIKLLRAIQEHWVWKDRPFSKGQAWIDMILLANHTENKLLINSQITIVRSGELITSQRKLAERWGWSRNTVRTFLNLLQKDKMILVKTNILSHLTKDIVGSYNNMPPSSTHHSFKKPPTPIQKTTHLLSHITILNYNGLQKNLPTKAPTTEPPIEPLQSHLLSINKNDNNDKNDNNNTNIVEVVQKKRGNVENTQHTKESIMENIVATWNSFCKEKPILSIIRELSEKRCFFLKRRLEKNSFKNFTKIIEAIQQQPFLLGENDRKWVISFDWLIENDTNYLKVLELKYKNTVQKKEIKYV